jgi:thymidylate kinase
MPAAPRPTWTGVILALSARALVRPRSALDLLTAGWAFRRRQWWATPPFLPLPDRTYLLLVDPQVAAGRMSPSPDRIEREDEDFRARVDRAYRELAEVFPNRITTIDGSRPPEEIGREILDGLRQPS